MYKIRIFFQKPKPKLRQTCKRPRSIANIPPLTLECTTGRAIRTVMKIGRILRSSHKSASIINDATGVALTIFIAGAITARARLKRQQTTAVSTPKTNAAKIPSNIRKSDIPAVCQNCDVPPKSTSRFATLTGPGSKSGLATAIEAACQTASQNSADIKFTISFFLNYPK